MKYPPYPSYKPSGVAWLGDVPVGWEVKRLKHSASVNDESLPETTDPSFEFSYVDISSVDPVAGIVNAEEMVFEDAPSRARRIVREGDIIVSTVRTYLRAIAPIRACKSKLIVSTGFAVIRPRTVGPDFLSYALQESGFVDTIVARSVGVSYPAVNASEIATISIPLPSPSEQHAIADFLDRQTGRIDTLIAKRRALIEKLKEKRSSLISRTVTRGLPPAAARAAGFDPHPPLKPSGVAWLGDVPVGWTVVPLNRCMEKFFDYRGRTPKKLEMDWVEEGIPAISANNVQMDQIDISSTNFGSDELYSKWMTLGDVQYGDVIMTSEAPLGKVAQIPDNQKYILSQRVVLIRGYPQKIENTYLKYYIMSSNFQYFLASESTGSTAEGIKMSRFKVSAILLPPLPEQRAIADFLDRQTAKIDRMVSLEEAVIGRMQEYRSALITAAVTGKIDVRERAEA